MFWNNLQKPFFALAPMANVTDTAFRQIIAKYGKPDIFFTEFVSADGLQSKGREILLRDLRFTETERPIVAQIFGAKPENFYESAKLVKKLGFDGVDINMGCPDRNVVKQGAGAKLIVHPDLAKEIIAATKEGARSTGSGQDLPVSVKTRIGFNKNTLSEWLPALLDAKPAAVTLHARTMKEMSLVPANWDAVREGVMIAKGSGVLILGNGDVRDLDDAYKKAEETGADGIMLGRAIFGNPFLFSNLKFIRENKNAPAFSFGKASERLSFEKHLKVLAEHIELFEKTWGGTKNFDNMKKHFKAYVNGFPGASDLRVKLMDSKSAGQVVRVIKNFLEENIRATKRGSMSPAVRG